jgi:uncharacterized protein (TIGR03083 family)
VQQTRPTTEPADVQDATSISAATPDEAQRIARVELDRLLVLLQSLDSDDWDRSTYCTRWNVRQIVSHLAGATATFASRDRVAERSEPWLHGKADEPGQTMAGYLAHVAGMPVERWQAYRDAGFNPLDAMTQYQVDERAEAAPATLIAELRADGPAAITTRRGLPHGLRSLQLPIGIGIKVPLQFFVDVILPRDMWMHRMEIALATDRPIVRMAEHEGRLTALVMRDLARRLPGDRPVDYRLTGPDGGSFRFWHGGPAATLAMDTVDFHLLASGRLRPDQALGDSIVQVNGDADLASRVLSQTSVPY